MLFSAAIRPRRVVHLNEQWPTYWSALFADAGMECFDVLRPLVWSDDRIEYYYRQNVLLFAREGVASRLRVRGLDSSVPMDAAHRELFERTVHDLNHRSVRHELRRLKEALRAAVDRRVP